MKKAAGVAEGGESSGARRVEEEMKEAVVEVAEEGEGSAAKGGELAEDGVKVEETGGAAGDGGGSRAAMGKRLAELKLKLNQARNLNTKEVEEELKRAARDPKAQARKHRAEERRREKVERKSLKESGAVFVDRKQLEQSAGQLEERDERKQRKRSAPSGEIIFSEEHLAQAFERRLDGVPEYEATQVVNGTVDDLEYGNAPKLPRENVDVMVAELESTMERREKFSRRRAFLEDQIDVDFINERNRKFNKKISRAFDEYTSDTKQSLERGTALPP